MLRWRYILPLRIRSLFATTRVEAELNEELAFHLNQKEQQWMAAGKSEAEARLLARKEFGNLTRSKEESRQTRHFVWLENVGQDLKSGYRSLRRSRFFAITVVATLALGIGATSALFAVVDGALLSPLAGRASERLVWLQEYNGHHEESGGNPPRFADWQRAKSFSALFGMYSDSAIFQSGDGPVHVRMMHTIGNPYETLAPSLLLGRPFTQAENRGEGAPVMMLTARAWRRYLASDAHILNKTLRLGTTAYQVVGILDADPAQGIEFPEAIDGWAPITADVLHAPRQSGFLGIIGRLAPGVSLQGAQSEVNLIASQLSAAYPATDLNRSASLLGLKDYVTHESRRPLFTLLAAATAVLLIACVNIAGLLVARGLARQREAAIRIAVGAGFARLARLFFAESLLLAGVGGLLGLALSGAGISLLKVALPQDIPHLAAVNLNGHVVACALAVSLVAVVLFGGLPAWQFALRGQAAALKSGGRGTTSGGGRLRAGLVVIEVALSLVLLVTAGLLANSFFRMRDQPGGFSSTNVYSFAVPFSWDSDPALLNSFAQGALTRLVTTPGVVSAGVVDQLPLHGGSQTGHLLVQGTDLDPVLADKEFSWRTASAGYFAAAGVPLQKGDVYRDWMGGKGDKEAMITDRLAAVLFPHSDPVGHYIAEAERGKGAARTPRWFRIVGVVGSVRLNPSDAVTEAGVYIPWGATYWPSMNFVVKSTRDLAEFSRLVRNHVQPLTNAQIVENINSLEALTAETRSSERVRTILLAAFAGAALALSAIGLFGTLSQEVARRTQDYGVRLALGAEPVAIAWSAIRSALLLAGTGVVMGVGVCIWTGQFLRGLLFGIEPWDIGAYASAVAVLLMTAVMAALIPAVKAARIDPISALRHE